MDKKIFNEIMRDYERIRQKNNRIIAYKKKDLYQRVPELFDIENQLTEIAFSDSKSVLRSRCNCENTRNLLLRKKNLLERRKNILDSLGLSENLFSVYDCFLCKDTGYIKDKKCKCFEQKIIEKYYDMSGLRNILSKENFDTFDFGFYSNYKNHNEKKSSLELAKTAYDKSFDFTDKFDSEFNNIIFYGDTGLGKTFLCHCIAKKILDGRHTVLYVAAPDLFRKTESEYRQMVFDSDLLIIDDLGSEFINTFSSVELFNIINSRLLSLKSTVISTNLSPVGLQQQYSARISSRIIGNYRLLKLTGEDIRLQIFKNKNKRHQN